MNPKPVDGRRAQQRTPSDTPDMRAARQPRFRNNEDGNAEVEIMVDEHIDAQVRNSQEELEGGRQARQGTAEEDIASGSVRRQREEADAGSLERREIRGSMPGNAENKRSSVQKQPRFILGNLGRAGSEMNVGGVHLTSNMMRAASLSTVRTPRGPSGAGSDWQLSRPVSSRQADLMERVVTDNYCSSCGEEEDLNESLLTTTTTTSSEQTVTYSSGSNSVAQECWENDIQSDGSLLYISCYFNDTEDSNDGNEILDRLQRQSESQGTSSPMSSILKPIETNRSGNKVIKLIRKKSLKSSLGRSGGKSKKLSVEIPSTTVKKLKSNFLPFGEPQDVSLPPGQNLNLGRRATLSEIKLGLQLDEAGDKLRVVGIIPESNIYHSRLVQMNDFLLRVNDKPVDRANINEVLVTLPHESEVHLRLQGTKSKLDMARERHHYKTKLISELLLGVTDCRTDLCLVYVNANGIQYKYPADKNNLSNSFGLFLTLNNMFENSPLYSATSSVECDAHIVFSRDAQYKNTAVNNLLLICFPQQQFGSHELCLKWNKMIVRCLRFEFGYELDQVFDSSNFTKLNRFFSFLFNRILAETSQSSMRSERQGERTNEDFKASKTESYRPLGAESGGAYTSGDVKEDSQNLTEDFFRNSRQEDNILNSEPFTFSYPKKLKLSSEFTAQINEALGELEANDTYEDDVKNFIVLGTCLFYKQYLLTAHMNEKDLLYVQSCLLCNGILQVNSQEKKVKNVIYWKQVFPKSHTVQNLYYNNNVKAVNVYYALIFGRGNFLLCTLLESNYFTNPATNRPGVHPDVKLIRHAEETVNFLIGARNYAALNKEIGLLRLSLGESQPVDLGENVSLSGSYRSHSTLTDEELDYRQSEGSALLPLRIVANGAIVYYIHVNKGESVQMTPDLGRKLSPHRADVFGKFERCVYKIEKVFDNYAKFKKLNSSLHTKAARLNRSTICVKEFGICFSVADEKFWTVGRLYNNAHQVFLCYRCEEEGVLCQNMIEILFTLCANYSS